MSQQKNRVAVEDLTPKQVRVLEDEFTWWEHDHAAANAEYIASLSTRYPLFKLRSYAAVFQDPGEGEEGKEQQDVAGMAIRQAYFELLETTFALLCAYLQAPDAVPIWMLRYTNKPLGKAAERLAKDINLPGSYLGEHLSAERFAEVVATALRNDGQAHPEEVAAPLRQILALALRNLLSDFNDKNFQAEYNAIKHGHRGRPGGIQLLVRIDGDSQWHSVIDSAHAMTFPAWDKVQGTTDIALRHKSTTYSIEHLLKRAEIALALLNLVTGLLVARAGLAHKTVRILFPNLQAVKDAWSVESGPSNLHPSPVYRFRKVGGRSVAQREVRYEFSIPVPRGSVEGQEQVEPGGVMPNAGDAGAE